MQPDIEMAKRGAQDAANWHLAWVLALGAGALAWPAVSGPTLGAALACATAPGVVGQVLRWRHTWITKALVAGAWPLGIGAAIALTGGPAGPLTPLAIAPVAAMATMDERRLVAAGAAAVAAVVAVAALAAAAGLLAPAPAMGPWLPLAALAAGAVGLA